MKLVTDTQHRHLLPWIAAACVIAGAASLSDAATGGIPGKKAYTTEFDIQGCTFVTTGRNPYFVLDPGHKAIFQGTENKEVVDAWITVTSDEETINLPGIGDIVTRVVEEREWVDGNLEEVALNFYAICEQTNSVFYFGETVDIYENGQIVSHSGAWRAGQNGALPGLFMPGTFLIGSRYYQEIAPGVALDRAENMEMGLTADVPAGHFTNVVRIKETNPLDPNGKEFKLYAPGVGVIVDDFLELIEVFDPNN